MEKLILIHVTDSEYRKIQNIASRMKITVDRIPDEIVTTNYKLGELVNGTYKKVAEMADATDQTGKNAAKHSSSAVTAGMQTKSRADSLILLCNLKEKRRLGAAGGRFRRGLRRGVSGLQVHDRDRQTRQTRLVRALLRGGGYGVDPLLCAVRRWKVPICSG